MSTQTNELELTTLLSLIKEASNLRPTRDRKCRVQVHPYLSSLQLALEDLRASAAKSGISFAHPASEFDTETQSTSDQTPDTRVEYATIVSELLNRFADLISKTEENLLSVGALEDLANLISVFKLIAVVPSTISGVIQSTDWAGKLAELWPPFSDQKSRVDALRQFAQIYVALSRGSPIVYQLLTTRFLGDFVVSVEHLKFYSPSEAIDYETFLEKSVSSVVVCRQLLQLLQSTAFVSKGPDAWLQRNLNYRLSKQANRPAGARSLLNAVDQLGSDGFWTNASACQSFAKLLLNVCNRPNFFKEVRTLALNLQWGPKLSLLLASLIELADGMPESKSSPLHIVFLDFMIRPFEMLWDNKLVFFARHDHYDFWTCSLDNSLWLAYLWSQHAAKLKHLNSLSRIDKLFGTCMLINGQLSVRTDENRKRLRLFPTAIENVIHGVLLSFRDLFKATEYLVDTLLAVSQSNLPNFSLNPLAKNLVHLVDENETKIKKDRHFDTVRLEIQDGERNLTGLVDLYVESLHKVVDQLFEKERSKFMINLLAVCMKKWAACSEQDHWSLSASKWSSASNRTANSQTSRLILEYFMGIFERFFENSVDKLDEDLLLKLLEISECLINKSTSDLDSQLAEVRRFDLRTKNDEILETRAKTLQLALSFCGLAMFESQQSEKISKQFRSVVSAVENFVLVVDANSELESESLKQTRDLAQQTLAICSDLFELDGPKDKQRTTQPGLPKKTTVSELLHVLDSDFADEADGTIEIAERGHAIISIERLIRKRDESIFAEVEGGLTKVFDLLTENLRHFDSYVYLSAVNALVELTSWKHSKFLPKIMFLLRSNELNAEDSDEEEEKISPKDKITTNARCRAQLGEALAKVAVELGDLAPSYFDQLSRFFLSNVNAEDSTVSASALSGLASLIVACRGRYFTKNIHEIVHCCAMKLDSDSDPVVRRASAHLLRSILVSCQLEMFSELRDSLSRMTSLLRRLRSHDQDSVIRLHSDLALLEVEAALKSVLIDEAVEKNTRVLNL